MTNSVQNDTENVLPDTTGEATLELYLKAVVDIQQKLLTVTNPGEAYESALEILGRTTLASRVYIFENSRDKDGHLFMHQKAEWCAEGIEPQIDNPTLQAMSYEELPPHWLAALSQGNVINDIVRELRQPEHKFLESQGILSILALPLIVNGTFFGFICFDDFVQERVWDEACVELLQAVTQAFSLAHEKYLTSKALQESQQSFREIFDNVEDLIYIVNLEGKFITTNKTCERITGYSTEEAKNLKLSDIMPPECVERSLKMMALKLEGQADKTIYETVLITKDGTHIPMEANTRVIYREGKPVGVLGISRNITERKKAESELQASQERFYKAFNASPVSIAITKISDGTILDLNETSLRRRGFTREEAIGRKSPEIHLWIDMNDRANIVKLLLEQGFVRGYQADLYDKDGKPCTVLISAEQLNISGEDCILWLSDDITDQRRAAEDLRLSEERYRSLAVATSQVVWSADSDGYVKEFHRGVTLTNREGKEIEGWKWIDLIHPEDRERTEQVWKHCLATGEVYVNEYRLLHIDGEYRHVIARAIPLRNPDGKIREWIGSGTDITEAKKAETSLKESEERYRAFLENSSEAIWRVEIAEPCPVSLSAEEQIDWYYKHAYLAECNDAMAKMHGYEKAEDLLGAKLGDLLPISNPDNIAYLKGFILSGYHLTEAESQEFDKDGNIKYFLSNLVGIVEDGYMARAWGTQRDITERKRAEKALLESEDRYRAFITNSLEAIWRYEFEEPCPSELTEDEQIEWFCRYAYLAECNDAMARMYGYERAEEIIGRRFGDLLPLSNEKNIIHLKDLIRSGYRITDAESNETDRHGQVKYFLNNVVGIVNDGKLLRFWGTQMDITALRQTQESLREINETLNALIQSAPVGIMVATFDNQIKAWNSVAEKILGWSKEEIVDVPFLEIIPEEYFEEFREARKKLLAGYTIENLETVRMNKGGTPVEISVSAAPLRDADGNINTVLTVFSDNTERKRAQKALSEGEKTFRMITEAISDFVYDFRIEPNGKVVSLFISDTFTRAMGFTKAELRERGGVRSLVHKDDLEDFDKSFAAVLGGHKDVSLIRLVKRNGEICWIRNYSQPVWDEKEQHVTRIFGSAQDITKQKLAEKALQESEERYRIVAETATDAIITIDEESKILFANQSAERIFGYAVDELLEQRSSMLMPKHLWERHLKSIKRYIKTGKRNIPWNSVEITGLHKDGHEIPLEISFSEIVKDGKHYFAGILRDVTERKRAEEALRESEERLRQAQKMEAIGRLAGGIAHDFNNILTSIIGYSEIGLRKLRQDDPLRRNLQEIHKAADRAATLTHQLLAYSRKQILQPKILDLNEIVSDMDKMLRRLIGEDVMLETKLSSFLWQVKADKGQIEQVLMNLTVNARDAMPKGGKLSIEIANATIDENDPLTKESLPPNDYIFLKVSDTGTGMTKETKARIFEPFFTTKDVGKGTGLGLATVYGIIEQSGGRVFVESEVEKGSTFKIFLPRLSNENKEAKPNRISVVDIKHGDETILLAEDDEVVRKMTQEFLEAVGYKVLVSVDCKDAIRICESYKDKLHLLLTDVVMPGMNGRELAETLTVLRSDMKVVYMSGYTDDEIGNHGVLDEGVKLIQKPYTLYTLTKGVRDVLDS